jgi:hypothetical protein
MLNKDQDLSFENFKFIIGLSFASTSMVETELLENWLSSLEKIIASHVQREWLLFFRRENGLLLVEILLDWF